MTSLAKLVLGWQQGLAATSASESQNLATSQLLGWYQSPAAKRMTKF